MKFPMIYYQLSSFFIKITVSELLNCGNSMNFEVEGYNDHVYVYDAEFSIIYERNNLAIYTYSNTDMVNVLINETTILFSGHIVKDTENYNPEKLKISRLFNSKIAGSAKLKRNLQSDDTLINCQFYLARNHKKENGDLIPVLQIEILHQAAVCIRSVICSKLGKISYNDFKNAEDHPFTFGPLSVILPKRNNDNISTIRSIEHNEKTHDIKSLVSSVENFHTINDGKESEIKSTTNILVDIVLVEITNEFRKENVAAIKIPNVSEKFNQDSIWRPTIEISTFDGTFSDITTLKRIGDAHLAHQNNKFTIASVFELTKAAIEFDKYKLRYSYLVSVSGALSVKIDGIKLNTTVSIDLNVKPCRPIFEKMHITELGNLSVKITGLGPLNGLLSFIVTWISEKWKMEIATNVESRVHEIVQKVFDEFDCEKFRP